MKSIISSNIVFFLVVMAMTITKFCEVVDACPYLLEKMILTVDEDDVDQDVEEKTKTRTADQQQPTTMSS